jgi:Paraquat-inducible protein A
MNRLKWILPLILLLASAGLCQQIVSNSLSNQEYKNDEAELNHVKYGLFSIEEWKRQITPILDKEINRLYLSSADDPELRKHIETLLNTLIDKVDKKIREEHSDSAGGRIAQTFINIFVSLEDIKKGIPEYADAVMAELTNRESRRQVKTLLSERLEEYSNQTFDTQDTTALRRILSRTDTADIAGARIKLHREISAKNDLIFREAVLLILLSAILFALSAFGREPPAPSRFVFLVLSLILLLTGGVTTPAIDMEAKISQMSFMVMGQAIHFENQVLYFQSKSLLDVFWIMMTHKDLQMKFVGVLLITFSILFPLLKIISSLGYYTNYHRARENPVIIFFVLKSGKWAMADVMVVALFMAYIGFNGIVTGQLGQLSSAGQEQMILTTNGTSLQPGYYLFLTYTLLALILSGFLTRKSQAKQEVKSKS